jgi:hypothetical protein
MTKIIKINAIVAAVLLLIGTFFKTSHWPGANIILSVDIAAGILLAILLIASFSDKLSNGFERFNGIIASIALIVGLLAFIFKLLHWPGAGQLIWVADISILLAGVSFLIDGLLEKDIPKVRIKLIAGFFILFLGLVIVLV